MTDAHFPKHDQCRAERRKVECARRRRLHRGGNVAVLKHCLETETGTKLDPSGHIVGDSEATKMCGREYEKGWEIRI